MVTPICHFCFSLYKKIRNHVTKVKIDFIFCAPPPLSPSKIPGSSSRSSKKQEERKRNSEEKIILVFEISTLEQRIMTRTWNVQKRNLRLFSKFNQNTVRWFQVSFRRFLGVLVTWWCFMIFLVIFRVFSALKNHQVISTPKTLRKLAWNHLTVFWLNFEKNGRFLFARSKHYL